jgi:ABC-2 type transport system permease protein
VRLYAEIARRGFRRYSTYRAATAAGVFTNTVFGFIQAYVLLALYESRAKVGGFDSVEALTYVFLTQGLLAPVDAFNAGAARIGDRIRTGDIVVDLYRPVDLQGYWLAMNLGRAGFQALARGIPPFVAGAIAFDLQLPGAVDRWAAFVASVALAVVASFGLRFAVSLSGFWLLDTRGAEQLTTVVMLFLGGFMLPITFFPPWLEALSRALPFAAMVQVPVEVFLGKASPGPALAGQVAWALVLLGLGRVVLAAATRKVVVQGG